MIPLDEVPRLVKSVETESIIIVVRAWGVGERKGKLVFNEY